jgi:hypothetical protein
MVRRRVMPAAFAVALLVVGQLLALAHNAATRHVECDEHGEVLEAAQLSVALHDCDQDHLVGVENDAGGDHDDCSIARLLQQSAATPDATPPPVRAPALDALDHARPTSVVAIATALYRIAPKTSPPDLV